MRLTLLAPLAVLALLPAPAFAETGDEALDQAAAELSDPARQAQVSAMAGAMIEAMMHMPVGPMLRAAADMAGEDPEAIDPDTTVADLAGDDAQGASAEVADKVPAMMQAMAGMSGAMATMLPHLREMAETMRRSLPETR